MLRGSRTIQADAYGKRKREKQPMKEQKSFLTKAIKPQTNLYSYRTSIIKLILSCVLAAVCILRPTIHNQQINTIVNLVCGAFSIPIVFLFGASVVEFITTFFNRRNRKKDPNKITAFKRVDIDSVIQAATQNAIIDFEVLWYDRILHCGSSSDCLPENSVFFDKQYFIDSSLYDNLDLFKKDLSTYLIDGSLQILSIDGIKQVPSKAGNG